MIKEETLEYLKQIIPEVLNENPKLFFSEISPDNWYESRKFFLEKNSIFLEQIKQKIEDKFQEEISSEDLFYMQKLFLIYPDYIPKKLLSLPWNLIKILLNICDVDKRKFYIDLCIQEELDAATLTKYILNDVYEKSIYLINEIQDYNVISSPHFISQVLNIYPMVWE